MKKKVKSARKKKFIDALCESNINAAVEEHTLSKIYTFWYLIL